MHPGAIFYFGWGVWARFGPVVVEKNNIIESPCYAGGENEKDIVI